MQRITSQITRVIYELDERELRHAINDYLQSRGGVLLDSTTIRPIQGGDDKGLAGVVVVTDHASTTETSVTK